MSLGIRACVQFATIAMVSGANVTNVTGDPRCVCLWISKGCDGGCPGTARPVRCDEHYLCAFASKVGKTDKGCCYAKDGGAGQDMSSTIPSYENGICKLPAGVQCGNEWLTTIGSMDQANYMSSWFVVKTIMAICILQLVS